MPSVIKSCLSRRNLTSTVTTKSTSTSPSHRIKKMTWSYQITRKKMRSIELRIDISSQLQALVVHLLTSRALFLEVFPLASGSTVNIFAVLITISWWRTPRGKNSATAKQNCLSTLGSVSHWTSMIVRWIWSSRIRNLWISWLSSLSSRSTLWIVGATRPRNLSKVQHYLRWSAVKDNFEEWPDSVVTGNDPISSSPKSRRTRSSTNGAKRSTNKPPSNTLWCEFAQRLLTRHSRIASQSMNSSSSRLPTHTSSWQPLVVFHSLPTIPTKFWSNTKTFLTVTLSAVPSRSWWPWTWIQRSEKESNSSTSRRRWKDSASIASRSLNHNNDSSWRISLRRIRSLQSERTLFLRKLWRGTERWLRRSTPTKTMVRRAESQAMHYLTKQNAVMCSMMS